MKQFVHTIRDPLGIHARPAGMIAKLAKSFADTSIKVSCNGREANASTRMKLISLGAREGSQVTIVTEGIDEDAAIIAMSNYFQNNL